MNNKLKKALSALLSLVMVIGLFSGVLSAPAGAKDACGYSPTMTMSQLAKSETDAEADQVIRISGVDEFMAFADYVNAGRNTFGVTFYINKDLNLEGIEWIPAGLSSSVSFKGVFDGCGFAALNFSLEAENDAALFGYVEGEGAEVKNFGVVGSVTSDGTAAGIAANLVGARIANSWSSINVTAGINAGGIAGAVQDGRIENCCNFGYISSDNNAGAIAGKVSGASVIEYSYYVYYSANKACGKVSDDSSVTVYRFAGSSTEILTEKELTVDHKTTDNLVGLLNEWVDMQKNSQNYFEWIYDNSEGGKLRVNGRYPCIKYPGYIESADSSYTATATMTALYESGQNAQAGAFYSISTTEELNYLCTYVNSGMPTEDVTFFLTADIIIQKTSIPEALKDWTPIGETQEIPFRGVFDGQGYVITGLHASSHNYKGLFGYVDSVNAIIKNLGVNGILTCNDHAGGIVACLMSGSVINCWFSGNITADDYVGGIAGSCDNGSIINCCCFTEVVGNRHAGGIVGELTDASQVRYCYYSPDNTQGCGDEKGTISLVLSYEESGTDFTLERAISVGSNPTIKLINALNHWVSDLSPDKTYRHWKIDDSAESIARILGKHPTHLFPGDSSGIKQVAEPEDEINQDGNPYGVKYLPTATMTELYESGANGIKGGIYSISSGDELKYLADYVNSGHTSYEMTFYLTGDINITAQCMGHEGDGWYPIGRDANLTQPGMLLRTFRGTFDGCGYTVTGLFLTNEKGDEMALFGQISGATIKNLGVVGDMVGELKCAGIAGEARNSKIYNCWSAVNVQAEAKIGGIVGYASDTEILNCVSYGAMLAYGGRDTVAGGIIGEAAGDCVIQNCFYYKDTTSNPYAVISKDTKAEIIGFTYGFIGDDYVCSLDSPANVDEISTTNLLTALNAWVFAQNSRLYSAWYNSAVPIPVSGGSGHFPRLMEPDTEGGSDDGEYEGDYEATCSVSQLYSMRSDGIEGCAYSINGLDDLESFQKYVAEGFRTEGVIFFMTRDIDMSQKYSVDSERSWKPIGDSKNEFRGIFDGQGYTIKYIYISSTDDDQGLFGHVVGISSVIKNLGICGIVTASVNAGSIVGDFNFGTIANCWSSCAVTATNNAGGIVGGANMGRIVNCASYGPIVSTGEYGAIAGYAFNTDLDYCYYLYGTCQQGYGIASLVDGSTVQHFNGTSMACILDNKISVEGTETRNALSALKLYVDAHPETNYCYWTVGNTEEYLLMGVEFFPVLLSACGTMGEKDYREVLAYYNGQEYRSLVKAINAANDNPDGGDVTLATNVVLKNGENLVLDDNVRLLTGDYSLNIKSEIKVYSMQQLLGVFTLNKDGGGIYTWDTGKDDYKLFMYAAKDTDASCNSEVYGTQSLTFISSEVKGDYPYAYNLTLQDGEFIVNSTLESGNPHKIPGGSTITIEPRGTLTVSSNARTRTTCDNSKIVNNGGTVKIGNATLNTNGGKKMVGVFEDDGGTVSLPFVYRDGYTLRGWSDGTNLYPAGSKLEAPDAITLTAQWVRGDSGDPYPGDSYYDDNDGPEYNIPITVVQSKGGTVSPDSFMAAKGENLSFGFTPAVDYRTPYYIKNVLVDGESVTLDENGKYNIVSVSRPHTIVAMFAPVTSVEFYEWRNPFTDVSHTDWCYDYVRYVASEGLFNGTNANTFSPTDTMTRDMVVVVLWRLAGSPVMPDEGQLYPDVPQGNYAYDAVRWANYFGIVKGFYDGSFGYKQPVTREQLVTFLYRFSKNYAGDNVGAYDNVNILGYTDVLEISKGMTQPFQWAIGAGIVNGTTSTTLSPKDYTTRAQVAAILSRYCNRFILAAPVFSG